MSAIREYSSNLNKGEEPLQFTGYQVCKTRLCNSQVSRLDTLVARGTLRPEVLDLLDSPKMRRSSGSGKMVLKAMRNRTRKQEE